MKSTVSIFCLVLCASPLKGELLTFNMLDPNGNGNDSANTAGEQFENGNSSVTISGITLNLSAATTLGDGTASYNANSTSGGLDSDGANSGNGGDVASGLDFGETLTLTWTFEQDTTLFLRSLDLTGVGNNDSETDSALVSIGGGSVTRLGTGAADFNGQTDVWAPDLQITSGETFVFTAEESFGLQQIIVESFSSTAIPEPSTFAFLGLGFAGVRSSPVPATKEGCR